MASAQVPEWWCQPRQTSILVDNDSWILPFAEMLKDKINNDGDKCVLVRNAQDIQAGTVNYMLGCTKLTPSEYLKLNRYNLVVHESDLPKGRGFAPLSWAILNGADELPVCLIEAAEEADAGQIYLRKTLNFTGKELNPELRKKQGEATIDLCLEFLRSEMPPIGRKQVGTPSWGARRTSEDSRLDVSLSLEQQFNLLRTVDNHRYPAFFEYKGRRYRVMIDDIGEAQNIENGKSSNE